jgi:hypothetical protein
MGQTKNTGFADTSESFQQSRSPIKPSFEHFGAMENLHNKNSKSVFSDPQNESTQATAIGFLKNRQKSVETNLYT